MCQNLLIGGAASYLRMNCQLTSCLFTVIGQSNLPSTVRKETKLTTKNVILAVSWLAGMPFYDDAVCLEVFWELKITR